MSPLTLHHRRLVDSLQMKKFIAIVKGGVIAWRIRVGSYRVIYEIHEGELRVLVITIGHRKDVYR